MGKSPSKKTLPSRASSKQFSGQKRNFKQTHIFNKGKADSLTETKMRFENAFASQQQHENEVDDEDSMDSMSLKDSKANSNTVSARGLQSYASLDSTFFNSRFLTTLIACRRRCAEKTSLSM